MWDSLSSFTVSHGFGSPVPAEAKQDPDDQVAAVFPSTTTRGLYVLKLLELVNSFNDSSSTSNNDTNGSIAQWMVLRVYHCNHK